MCSTRILGALIVVVFVLVLGAPAGAQAAQQGAPRGVAGFHGAGDGQDYAPDGFLWGGKLWGQSVTDSGQGALHYGAWDCTGELALQGGKAVIFDGFCTVTHADGSKINLRWEVDERDANPADARFKGTYLSGTGPYAGIQGHYIFQCKQIADLMHYICDIIGGEYRVP